MCTFILDWERDTKHAKSMIKTKYILNLHASICLGVCMSVHNIVKLCWVQT